MKTLTKKLIDQVENVADSELIELGDVSRETKGGAGSSWDGGFGWAWME